MSDQIKNVLIGLFVSAAIAIAVCMILFLEPEVGDGKQILQVRFANVAGIQMGTRVTYAGKPVGEVISITEVKNARLEPTDESGKVYLYQLGLKIDSKVAVYKTDEVAIRSTGLMGERSIAILPKAQQAGKELQLADHQILYANSVDPLENTLSQISKVSTRVQDTLAHFDLWFDQNKNALSSAIQSFSGAMSQAEAVLGSLDETQIIPAARESIALLSDNLASIRTSLNDDHLLAKTSQLLGNLNVAVDSYNLDGKEALRNLNAISHEIATGTGTVGRLINSEDFYLRVSSLLGKADTLMNDINHYGILFQYDKSWQRSRTKRANQMQALQSPAEFRTYFEGEVDTIQTALGRLTELLGKADSDETRQKIIQSDRFKTSFGQLLRQVQSLTDSIRLYNEELVALSEVNR